MSRLLHKTIFDGMPNAAMILDTELRFVDANDAYCRSVQRDKSDMLGRYVFDVFPDTPDRIKPILSAFKRTLAGEVVQMDAQPYKLKLPDGRVEDRVWQTSQFPVRCDAGNVEYLVQRAEDITEREKLRTERDLVNAELNHRVRNTLAVVQSVAEHTGLASRDIESFLTSFSGRLAAISRNFAALSESHWQGLDFEQICRTELVPYAGPVLDRITLKGPAFKMSVKATKDTSMIVHELITNASKYGFLTSPTGRLDIAWSLRNDTLIVNWIESGVDGVTPPIADGFGFQLFELMPNIHVIREFAPDGLKLRFQVAIKVVSDEVVFRSGQSS
ncbi:MAG: HWE histidine kinase domain-containing protein [Pseudomonadota bacterium]